MKLTKPVLLTTLVTLSLPVIAEEQSPIIVTATRTAQTADDSLASVTVITRQDIEQSMANSVTELLTGYAGIDTDTNGGLGQESNIYMRGTDKSHVLILLNGIKFGSATTGRVALQYIPVSIIERIEIVRGPRSSLYGSEAIGGVIQIFTKTDKKQSGGFFKLSSGSYGTSNFALGLNKNTDNSSLNISFDNTTAEGFDARVTKNPDKDGYKNSTFNLNYNHQFNNKIRLETHLLNSTGRSEYDGFSTSSTYHREFIEQALSAKTIFSLSKNWEMSLGLSHSDDKKDSFKNTVKSNTYNTQRQRFTWQNDITVTDNNIFTIGADYLNDTIQSTEDFPVTERATQSAFIQHQWFGKENDFLISARYDDIDDWGTHTTGNIAWGHQINNDTRMFASYATAFKAPTFNELYHPTTSSAEANANLLAEDSESYEIGLSQKTLWGKWNIQIFRNDINNLIVFGFPNNNVDNAQIDGSELSIDTNLNNWVTKLSLTIIEPVNKDTGEWLERRSKRTTKLTTDKKFGSYSVGGTILSQGARMDGNVQLEGYSIINLRMKKHIDKTISISLKANNIEDKRYQTVDGYRMQEANFYVGLEHNF